MSSINLGGRARGGILGIGAGLSVLAFVALIVGCIVLIGALINAGFKSSIVLEVTQLGVGMLNWEHEPTQVQ